MNRRGLVPVGIVVAAFLCVRLVAGAQSAAAIPTVAADQQAATTPACGGTYLALADTSLYSDAPGAAHGSDIELQVVSTATYTHTALLAFDLGASIPISATIDSADLELTVVQEPVPLPYAVQVHAVDQDWGESSATWNNAPVLGAALRALYYTQRAPLLLRVDARDLVNLWASGAVTQTSILLQPAAGSQIDLHVASREAVLEARRPRLVVRCTVPSPPAPYDAALDDARQMAGFARLSSASLVTPTLQLENGTLRFGAFEVPVPDGVSREGLAPAMWFMTAFSDTLRLSHPETQMQLTRRSPDGQTLFFRQRHLGVPVFPSEVAVHLSQGHVTLFVGGYLADFPPGRTPSITSEQASTLALALAAPGIDTTGDVQLRYLNLGFR